MRVIGLKAEDCCDSPAVVLDDLLMNLQISFMLLQGVYGVNGDPLRNTGSLIPTPPFGEE